MKASEKSFDMSIFSNAASTSFLVILSFKLEKDMKPETHYKILLLDSTRSTDKSVSRAFLPLRSSSKTKNASVKTFSSSSLKTEFIFDIGLDVCER